MSPNCEPDETARLLTELDQAIDRSSLLRSILNRCQRLHDLEQLTGPTRKTRSLRKQIRLLEARLDRS